MKTEESINLQIDPKTKKLYIFFGGINGKIGGIPPFEFYQTSKLLNASKIFLRDLDQAWYQTGLPGLTKNCFETKELILKKILEIQPKDTIFVGNSMGGFAAILFGVLIGKGRVVAFSPQTFISLRKRFLKRDSRWNTKIYKTYLKSFYKKHIYDLKNIMKVYPQNKVNINVYVSLNDKMDCLHAENISQFDNVKLNKLSFGNHGVVKSLRNQGKLDKILEIECF